MQGMEAGCQGVSLRRPCSLAKETTKLTRRRDSTFGTDEANDCLENRAAVQRDSRAAAL